MADISLRDYLAKLDTLLKKGASDEVIHHCRHILQYFPKNAAAYRYLGLALANAGNWQKAGEVFRRVLGVYPDDFMAHIGLSEVYSNLKRPDEAIWHLERAYEQDPNNQEIINSLREMYHKFRRVEQSKLQLTSGAVARQYIRNGLYDQAIESLKQSLERNPERTDLLLLLARTYQDSGRPVEAGETAVEVLKVLPDCLEANEILTEIWLEVQRPSDAQRYLNRIQSLDPYHAMELAQGKPAPDEQFRLEELDYRRSAQQEIVSRAPDWLQDIEPVAAESSAEVDLGDWMSGMSMTAPAAEEDALPDFDDDLFSTELPDDWLTASQSQPSEAASPADTSHTGLTGLLSALEVPEETTAEAEPEPEPASESSGDFFAAFEAVDTTEPESLTETADEFADLFAEPAQPVAPPSTSPVGEADPLAWMHESGIELVEQPEQPLFEDEDELSVQAADEVNPLAWLEGYGDHLITDEARAVAGSEMEEAVPTSEDEGELDWMQQSVGQDLGEPQPVQEKSDPLDWLTDESLLEEALNMEALTNQPDVEASPEEIVWAQDTTQQSDRQDVMAEENPFAWLDSQDDDQQAKDNQQPVPEPEDWSNFSGFAQTESGEPAAEPESNFEWMTSEEQPSFEVASEEFGEAAASEPETPGNEFEWVSSSETEVEAPAVTAGEMPGWLSQLDSQEADIEPSEPEAAMPEWLLEVPPLVEPEPAVEAEVPDWLAQAQPEMEAEPAAEAEAPEWLAGLQPEAEAEPAEESIPATETSELEWMAEAVVTEDEPIAEAEVPEWLAGLQPQAEEEPAAVESEMEWTSEAVVTEDEPIAEAEVPEWLAEAQPQVEAEPAATGSELEWMSEAVVPEAETPEAEPAQADVPDWLAEMQSRQPETQEPVAEEAGWEAQAEDAGADTPAEFAEAEPDWLAEMQAQPPRAAEPETMDEPSWISDLGAEAESESSAAAGEVPDWLGQLEPQQEEPEAPEAEAADEPSWLSELEVEEDTVPGQAVEESVWTPEEEPESENAEAEAATPDWLSELQPQAEAEPPEAEETFGWMEDAGEQQPVSETGVPESEFDWGEEPTGALESSAENVPDWMNELQPPDEIEAVTSEPATAEYSWIDDINAPDAAVEEEEALLSEFPDFAAEPEIEDAEFAPEEEVVPSPASNAPDWLNAMVPGLDVDYAAPEDEPIEQTYADQTAEHRQVQVTPEAQAEPASRRGFDWLVELVDEETHQMPAVQTEDGGRGRFIFSRLPAWMRRTAEKREDDPGDTGQAADTETDSDLPPWLR